MSEAALGTLRAFFPSHLHDRLWLVGGGVRDLLLGKELRDFDLVAAVPVEALLRLGFYHVPSKSSAPIFFRNDPLLGKLEITHIESPDALTDDLQRRDFCANAMAMTLTGDLLDPLGGQRDLSERLLRPCGPATFVSDPARIFRALRFAADDWQLSDECALLLRAQDWNAALALLPVERFSTELIKALASPEPQRFLRGLLDFNVGRNFLPELFHMPLVPAGPPEHHPEGDLFTHSCEVLTAMLPLAASPLPRFCAFFHDLGKLATDPACYPRHRGHEEAGFLQAPPFCRRLALPTAWGKGLAWACRLHGDANRWTELRDATRIRIATSALQAGIADFLPQLAAADWPEGPGLADWPLTLRAAQLNAAALDIAPETLARQAPAGRGVLLLHARINWLRRNRPVPL